MMSMEEGISRTPPTNLIEYSRSDRVILESEYVPGISVLHYRRYIGPHHISMGVYTSREHGLLFRVWGVPESLGVCCRYHQIFDEGWGETLDGQPKIEIEKTSTHTVVRLRKKVGTVEFRCSASPEYA
jgi:hypothetical protein